MSDKRSTLTDAVATLGTLIDQTQQRDAIHLATEPVVAAKKLFPGQDVGLDVDGMASPTVQKMVGIVDPFLKAPVMPGERFWLIVYPRQITSLRHMWEHPDFPPLTFAAPVEVAKAPEPKSELTLALEYLEQEAANNGVSYDDMMQNAQYYEGENAIYASGGTVWVDTEFWENYSCVTGKNVTMDYIDDGCRGC